MGLVLPHLNGKLDGFAIRVPTINVSVVDLTFVAKRATSVEEVNKAVEFAESSPEPALEELFTDIYVDAPEASKH